MGGGYGSAFHTDSIIPIAAKILLTEKPLKADAESVKCLKIPGETFGS